MERKRFQGVLNVLRFNWHFYALAVLAAFLLIAVSFALGHPIFAIVGSLLLVQASASILVTYLVYDRSSLYDFGWLEPLEVPSGSTLINLHAGFDETSESLASKYAGSCIRVFDFYDPTIHTERSIARARRVHRGGRTASGISTDHLPMPDRSVDVGLLIFSAHEIRIDAERVALFRELHRSMKDNGRLVVTEHLRDLPNYLAYNIGAFHFLSRATWLRTFAGGGFRIASSTKITPFVTTFILEKDGTAS